MSWRRQIAIAMKKNWARRMMKKNRRGKNEEEAGVKEPLAPVSCPANIPVRPFLTNPMSCGAPREVELSVDGWNEPGNFATGEHVISKSAALPALSGCEHLDFSPTISVQPDGSAGSTPTGLNVDVHVPQESTSNPVGLGEADVRDTTVTLPAGVQISPSAADGLQACSQAQIGLGQPGKAVVSGCVEDRDRAYRYAVVGTRTGRARSILAAPQNFAGLPENPFSIVDRDVPGRRRTRDGRAGEARGEGRTRTSRTGQLTTTFENTPQLPFSESEARILRHRQCAARDPRPVRDLQHDLVVHAVVGRDSGEPRTKSRIPPRAFGSPPARAGAACANPLPFTPSLSSGATNINAGSFSDLTTTLSREDGQQQHPAGHAALPAGPVGHPVRHPALSGSPGERGDVSVGTAGSGKRSCPSVSATTRSASRAGRCISPARMRAPRSDCRS